MSDRYYVNDPIGSDHALLTGAEAHHLIHVMRALPGARVVLFDGGGAEFPAVVERLGRHEVELSIVSRQPVDRELPVAVTLGAALPKGDRQKWLVEKAVELGVARLVPLRTTRGVSQPVEQTVARLRRAVIEASKQCGRNRLMQIAAPRDWSDFMADAADAECRLAAHPRPHDYHPSPWRLSVGQRVFLAVGPEGGLTDQEVALAVAAGWRIVDLGPRILRVETAALTLAAMAASAVIEAAPATRTTDGRPDCR